MSGWDIRIGLPSTDEDHIGVWGNSPTSPRGEAVAHATDTPIVRVEDAFLRSVLPARLGGRPPVGLLLDKRGVHYDGTAPSDLEHLLANSPLDDTAVLNSARAAIERLRFWHLGKYSAYDPSQEAPAPGYVVVLDQSVGDAALLGAGRAEFLDMLELAKAENPGCPVLIKSHPEADGGARAGHFTASDEDDRTQLVSGPISPWILFEGAVAVYTHSSNLGFEAIFSGHKPHVFGQPFYAGWTLTQDRQVFPRRGRELTRAQIFAGALMEYPVWYDETRDAITDVHSVISTLAAEATAWRQDQAGWIGVGMRRWKRRHFRKAFPGIKFASTAGVAERRAKSSGRNVLSWGNTTPDLQACRVEDGLLRSRGLGADLTLPVSFLLDQQGLAVDPSKPSEIETKIQRSETLPIGEIERANDLIQQILRNELTKYNISGGALPPLPDGRKILVLGQVEDDISVTLGTSEWTTNNQLLTEARDRNPGSVILWKPHPDVEAGLRHGRAEDADHLADVQLQNISAHDALSVADEVWTLTSTMGFEALLRGIPVTCLGMPFYAGWGLTTDLVSAPMRRQARPQLAGLVHAALIGSTRYVDPISGQVISPEAALEVLMRPMPQKSYLARAQALIRKMGL